MSRWKLGLFFAPQNRGIMTGVVLAGLFSLGLLVYQARDAYDVEYQKAGNDVSNVSLLLEQQTEDSFRHLDLVLREIKEQVEAGRGYESWTTSRLNELAKLKFQNSREIMGLKFFDSQGKYIGSEDGVLPEATFTDGEYFQSLKTNPKATFSMSRPFIGKNTGIQMVILGRRVDSPQGQFAGMISIAIPVETLSKNYSSVNLGKSGSISLFAFDGRILLTRYPLPNPEFIGKSFADRPLHRVISTAGVSDGMTIQIAGSDHDEKIYSYRVMHDVGLLLTVGVSTSEIKRVWAARMGLIIIYYLLASFAFLILLHRYLRGQNDLEFQRMQLIQNSKMSALGEMAAGIAHEINNPLTIIKGRAEQLERLVQRPDFDREKAVSIVMGIEKTTARIANIVKGLRTFSRSGELDPMAMAYIPDIVNASLELSLEKFKQSNVELRVKEIPSIATLCRETQISQVVLNLLGNAFDAVLGTEKPWVELSFKEYSKNIEIIVTDSGNGISPEIEAKIMQPFFTTKTVGKGTGLGLSISKGIIEGHQGKLFLNRNSEHTQFVVSLPKVDSEAYVKKVA